MLKNRHFFVHSPPQYVKVTSEFDQAEMEFRLSSSILASAQHCIYYFLCSLHKLINIRVWLCIGMDSKL